MNHLLRINAFLLLSLMITASSAQTTSPAKPEAHTRVVMLGTGNPNADPDRSGPAVAIVRGTNSYLVDAGPGIVRRASSAQKKGIDALTMPRLRIVFLTHLH